MSELFAYLNDTDFTVSYAVMVWAGVLLALAWAITMHTDPANANLPEWDQRFRRIGVIIMISGFIASVLFGGDKAWAPWPTMLIVIFGFDFYLAAAIFSIRQRLKIRERFESFLPERYRHHETETTDQSHPRSVLW